MTTVIKRCKVEKKKEAKERFRKKLVIPESEISECPEYDPNQKQERYLSTKKYLNNILLRFMKLIHIFMSTTKKQQQQQQKKNNLMKIYYSELMLIFLNIFQLYKLMEKAILIEIFFLWRKDKKHQTKNLAVNLLELVQVNIMMKIMKLV